ncbi:MAG: FGGY-family carbohydrate kinase [Clostridia bacterium]|nr:FGGY-family carbohydrate kinase [Clostridia bacterium]
MENTRIAEYIASGLASAGIELGSTRIKAVLIGDDFAPIAQGDHAWENRLENGVWTYHLEDVWAGIQDAFANLKKDVESRYGVQLTKLAGLGISAMMHGYLVFDKDGKQLAEFRTWRNTMTGPAAEKLTAMFGFNIPQRWTIAHLGQAILNKEGHVGDIDQLTTLAGYVHAKLTGCKVVGVGEASGIFPIDDKGQYDAAMVEKFDAFAHEAGYGWKLTDILPGVLSAGDDAGTLTAAGALLLDPTGQLQPGTLMAPPEGDAGTGMVATNSVAARTGNVSAGTSVFAMIVMEKALSKVYPEIDMVTTPTGRPVAMVHCNNCTSDINAWAGMLQGFAQAMGMDASLGDIFPAMFKAAALGDKDCGGVINYNYFSGEPVTGLDEGRPMLVRMPDAKLSFQNLCRSLVFGAVASLKLGMDILTGEKVAIDRLLGHGGFFKTPEVGQRILSSALGTPVSCMTTAGEGGPWGMAILAAYRVNGSGMALEDYLTEKVFAGADCTTIAPDAEDADGFAKYIARYAEGLKAEQAAVDSLK